MRDVEVEDEQTSMRKNMAPWFKKTAIIIGIIITVSLIILLAVSINNTPTTSPTPTPGPTAQPVNNTTKNNTINSELEVLPPGCSYRMYAGPYGPQKILVYTYNETTPAVYDPEVGIKDDQLNLLYGWCYNYELIPAVSSTGGITHQGYYNTTDQKFHYSFYTPSIEAKIYNATGNASKNIDTAKTIDRYALGDVIIVDDKLYARDNTGNLIRITDGTPVIIVYTREYPTIMGPLNIDWQNTNTEITPPTNQTGYGR